MRDLVNKLRCCGYDCVDLSSTGTTWVCMPACTGDGDCPEPGSCHVDGGYCFFDACDLNPCAVLANSDGVNTDMTWMDYWCGCNDGYYWELSSLTCREFFCMATPINPGDALLGDTCTGTAIYDPEGSGESCLAGVDDGNPGWGSNNEDLSFTNETGADGTFYIIIDTFFDDPTLCGTYDLDVL